LLLLLFNLKDAVTWIRKLDNEDKFIDCLAIRVHIRDRSYNALLHWMPTTFNPTNNLHLREVEEVNSLPNHLIQKAHWIKLTTRRCAGQT
jgi:hypothetical protein